MPHLKAILCAEVISFLFALQKVAQLEIPQQKLIRIRNRHDAIWPLG